MPQPTAYTRQADFSDHSTNNPDDPHVGTDMDAEFDAVKTTLDEILVNLALIQRDDGALANQIVTSASLASGLSVGVEPATTWVTATAYAVSDLVWESGKLYICDTAHTSGTFATDLAANNWTEILDLASEVPAVTGVFGNAVTAMNNAGSPYTLTEADNGKFYNVDTSSGAVSVNLPDSSGLTDGDFVRYLFRRTSASNTLTLNRSGSDTIDGATSQTVSAFAYKYAMVFATGGTDWGYVEFGLPKALEVTNAMLAGSIAGAKLLNNAIDTAQVTADAITLAKIDMQQDSDASVGSGTHTADMGTYGYQKITATGNFTLDVTPPTSKPGGAVYECVNFGAHTVTFTGIDLWAGGSAPTFTSSGTDFLGVVADDAGQTVGYLISVDAQ